MLRSLWVKFWLGHLGMNSQCRKEESGCCCTVCACMPTKLRNVKNSYNLYKIIRCLAY